MSVYLKRLQSLQRIDVERMSVILLTQTKKQINPEKKFLINNILNCGLREPEKTYVNKL